MSVRSIWALLGVRATADRSAIRRAYAERLKTTNPEDDPEGFKALRSAYEAALAQAAWRASQPAGGDGFDQPVAESQTPEEGRQEAGEPAAAGDGPDAVVDAAACGSGEEPGPEAGDTPPTAGAAAPGEASAPEAAPDGRPGGAGHDGAPQRDLLRELREACDALGRMLAEDGASPHAMGVVLDQALASPLLSNLRIHADTETWLARTLAMTIPRSDPVIPPTSAYFGWPARAKERDLPTEIRAVLFRAEDLDLLRQFANPKHPFHKGYVALTTPPDKLGGWARLTQRFRQGSVDALLKWVRARRPSLMESFHPKARASWNRRLDEHNGVVEVVASVGVALVLVVTALGYLVGHDPAARQYQAAPILGCVSVARDPDATVSQMELAKTYCDRDLQADSGSIDLHKARGLLYLRTRRPKFAVPDFWAVEDVSPNDPEAHLGAAVAEYQEDRSAKTGSRLAKLEACSAEATAFYKGLGLVARSVIAPHSTGNSVADTLQSHLCLEAAEGAATPPPRRIVRDLPGPATFGSARIVFLRAATPTVLHLPAAGLGALKNRVATVDLRCTVLAGGKVSCAILSESPAGFGVGATALRSYASARVAVPAGRSFTTRLSWRFPPADLTAMRIRTPAPAAPAEYRPVATWSQKDVAAAQAAAAAKADDDAAAALALSLSQ